MKITWDQKNDRWLDPDGEVVPEPRGNVSFTSPQAHHRETWPLHSDSAGVHPAQAHAAFEKSKELGVPTEFDHDGCAVFTSRSHRKKYLAAYGLWDKDGGYGD